MANSAGRPEKLVKQGLLEVGHFVVGQDEIISIRANALIPPIFP